MLEDVSRTPNGLKMTHNKNICILEKRFQFGDTILRGGYGIRDQLQNPAHVLKPCLEILKLVGIAELELLKVGLHHENP